MFRPQSYSYSDLDDLLRLYIGKPDSAHIVELLQATRNFISSTSTAPDMMKSRAAWIKDENIKRIFDEIGNGLQQFKDAPSHQANEAIYEQCINTIKEQMQMLKFKEDKIFIYYKNNANPLQAFLKSKNSKKLGKYE